jgi:hypothetical protein
MAIHLVYRSSGKENTKPRPRFYSKALALASFLRAVDQSSEVVNVIFLNDAPIPRGTLKMMGKAGEVLNRNGLTLERSYREAITLPLERGWPSSDLVYLSEDDYLFRPEAFTRLARAARDIPQAAYFAFYASTATEQRRLPTAHGDWRLAESTTSSFGARISVLAADRWLHLIGCRAEGDFDRAICMAYAGRRPYSWQEVPSNVGAGAGLKATTARVLGRATLNLGSYRARRQCRLLVTELPSLATHMEEPHLAEGVDWAEVATDTNLWAEQRGFSLDPAAGSS